MNGNTRLRVSDRRALGRRGLQVTVLGAGTAPLGGMFSAVPIAEGEAMLEAAWARGIRYFDTAPMYGLGRAELILGHVLRRHAEQASHDPAVLGTKVGRLILRERPGREVENKMPKNEFDPGWHGAPPFEEVFDYSYDAIMRSFDDSHQRLGLARIDVLNIHDIGAATHGDRQALHWRALTEGGGFRALDELRRHGLIGAVGVGANEWQIIRETLDSFDLDCCLLAGRYTLLDQSALADLLPVCAQRGVSVVIGGPFNSGVLAAPPGGLRKFNYADPPADILERVGRIEAACRESGVPVPAAALQFPLAHPAVSAVLVGCRTAGEMDQAATWLETPIPSEAWSRLREDGLLDGAAPVPPGAAPTSS